MGKGLFVMTIILVAFNEASGQSFYDYKIDRRLIGSISIGSATYYGDIQSELNFAPTTGQISLDYNAIVRDHFFQQTINDQKLVRRSLKGQAEFIEENIIRVMGSIETELARLR